MLDFLFALIDKALVISIISILLLAFYNNADRIHSIKIDTLEIEFYQSQYDTQ